MKRYILAALALAVLAGASTAVLADDDRPPAGSKPLSETLAILESQGFREITEASMDDGVWEVDVFVDGRERKLTVDPHTATVLSDRDDD